MEGDLENSNLDTYQEEEEGIIDDIQILLRMIYLSLMMEGMM